jgi:hypothetical protein
MEFDRAGRVGMTGDLALQLEHLCEFDPPEMSRQWIDRHESKESINALISCGALVPGENASSVPCERCDGEHWIGPEYLEHGQYRGFCPVSGYHSISASAVQRFVVDETWISSGIAAALGIRPCMDQFKEAQPALGLGRVKFGPYTCELFFGWRLYDRSRLERANSIIAGKSGVGPAILLTSTRKELLSVSMPERCVVIRLETALTISRGKIIVNDGPMLAALRGPTPSLREGGVGFHHSPAYRTCLYGSDSFRFSETEARVVEVLHGICKEGLPCLHQEELRGKAETTQRIAQLFHGHPAYGTLIKNDGKGFYWLDL